MVDFLHAIMHDRIDYWPPALTSVSKTSVSKTSVITAYSVNPDAFRAKADLYSRRQPHAICT